MTGKQTEKQVEQQPQASVRRSIWPWKSESDGSASFLRAARAGNLEKVLEHLNTHTDINTSNANGLNALHLASKEGHSGVVEALIEKGANVDSATKKGNTALHIASLAGQEDIVRLLVASGASVNIQSQNGFTPLYMAAQENHDTVVRFLLSHGANQSLATEDGFTPLAVALQQGHDRVVAVLLENDTRGKVRLPALHIAAKKDDTKAAALLLHTDNNPDVTSKSGFTPLHIAAHYGNDNIAALLLQRGADVNYVAKHQITPLHVASKWGKANMVSLLLEKGATIDAKTRDGLTPLHCSARSGHEGVVDTLMEKGAPITAKTKNGLAPLHMASQGDHVDAARILLYHKAPVDDVTVDFLTALHVAAHCGHVRVAKLLLDRKADPNARALNGFTPLHIACKKNRIKVVELLLKHGASIEATTESGLTPLHVASFMGCMNIVIYLLQHGASSDVPTIRGETPLHLAARANQTDIIRILLRNGAEVDARAREQQTALHIASRLGNCDIVSLLLQHGASTASATKDLYTPLHIAAKEGREDVAAVLLDRGASVEATTKKGFTPLHLAAKYGNLKVAKLLLAKEAPVDARGKNGVTPLHVAAHYDHQNVALLLLDKGAAPDSAAKNGFTPMHIAARKNQMDIAATLFEYGAGAGVESKAGFTPLHLSAQEGHPEMTTLLIDHGGDPGVAAKNGLTPLHLCAQGDRVGVGAILVKGGASIDPQTKAGYTPLHVAAHFGMINMVRFLLQHATPVDTSTALGYTPLHQAAQQGHTQIVNLLLEHKAEPNMETNDGKTALSIAQRLGYISVVETLKVVTETHVTTTTTTTTEEKYKVVVPETMHETFMSESEDEGGDDTLLVDQSYRYLTVDEMKSLGDDSLPIDVTRDEKDMVTSTGATLLEGISPMRKKELLYTQQHPPGFDNVDIGKAPVLAGVESLNTTVDEGVIGGFSTPVPPSNEGGSTVVNEAPQRETVNGWEEFLVSFMVDARGGAMRGCRHSGVRVIIPPRKAAMPMRITCRYLKKDKLVHAPPLMEGEALASRILEMGPSGAKFLGPVIIEVPHFASLRGKEREIVILRSDNGETWREHTLEATEEAVQEVLNESFDGEELKQLEDLNTNRITRILTTDFPQYFAIVTRIRQEVHAIGPEGGMVSSTVVPQVQAVFPQGALTKKIKVGLQAQPISPDLVSKLLGNRVAVSPIVTVEPRRRKFHKPITLTIPIPQAASKGMINQYSGDAPTLRLLCSITGGTTRAQWEDVTGSTPLTFVNDCVSFTTTVSARFWLLDCTNIPEATKMATELYREAIHVPFMAKFVVFSKRHQLEEARVRVFCMTDDKEDKTLETQENFVEVSKSRDVEVLEGKVQYLEVGANLVPVTKSGDQLAFSFYAFRENRLPFTVRVKDSNAEPVGRIAFMRQPKVSRGDLPQTPICHLNVTLPDSVVPEPAPSEPDLLSLQKKYAFLSISKTDAIHRAELRLSDISNMLSSDWVDLARELNISPADVNIIASQYVDNVNQQAIVMLRLWMQTAGNKQATGNTLEKALRAIDRLDIVQQCICNVELVTDDTERKVAKERLDSEEEKKAKVIEESVVHPEEPLTKTSWKEEIGETTPHSPPLAWEMTPGGVDQTPLIRDTSLEVSYDEKDLMKEAESAEEDEDSLRAPLVDVIPEEVRETPIVAESRKQAVLPTPHIVVESQEEITESHQTESSSELVREQSLELAYEQYSEPIQHREHSPELVRESSPELVRESSPKLVRRSSPELEREPSPELERESSPELVSEPSPKLERQPSPKLEREPSPELEREPSPELEREPSPELEREPSPELEREPSPELERELSPELEREPSPELERELSPELERELSPELEREPYPELIREPSPELVREPTPELKRETSPELTREKSPEVTRESSSPFVRETSPELAHNILREQSPELVHKLSPELVREPSPEVIRVPFQEPVGEPSPKIVRELSLEFERELSPELVREPPPERVREPSPERVREPSPELVREPSPELVREPSPEIVREQSPEIVREPSSELVRELSPEVVRKASPISERELSPELAQELSPDPIRVSSPEQTVGQEPTPELLVRDVYTEKLAQELPTELLLAQESSELIEDRSPEFALNESPELDDESGELKKDALTKLVHEQFLVEVEETIPEKAETPHLELVREPSPQLARESLEFDREPSPEVDREHSPELDREPSPELEEESSLKLLRELSPERIEEPSTERIQDPSTEIMRESSPGLGQEQILEMEQGSSELVQPTFSEAIHSETEHESMSEHIKEPHSSEKTVLDDLETQVVEESCQPEFVEHIIEEQTVAAEQITKSPQESVTEPEFVSNDQLLSKETDESKSHKEHLEQELVLTETEKLVELVPGEEFRADGLTQASETVTQMKQGPVDPTSEVTPSVGSTKLSGKVAEGGDTEDDSADRFLVTSPFEESFLMQGNDLLPRNNNIVKISAPLSTEGVVSPVPQFYRVGPNGELILFEEEISPSSAGTQAEGGDALWAQHRPTSLKIASSEDNETRTNDASRSSGGNKLDATRRIFFYSPDVDVADGEKEVISRPANRPSLRSALLKVKVEKRSCGNHSGRGSALRETSNHAAPLRSLVEMFQTPTKTSSAEAEVLGLMEEMKEVTQQIKSEVRQLRASDTPTPDTPTPLREFRDFLTKEEQEQELERLPTITEDEGGGFIQHQFHQEEAGTYNLQQNESVSVGSHPVEGEVRQVGYPWAGWEYVRGKVGLPSNGTFCPCGRHKTLHQVAVGVAGIIDELEVSIRSKRRVEIVNMLVTLQALRMQTLDVIGGSDVTRINDDDVLGNSFTFGDVVLRNDVYTSDVTSHSVYPNLASAPISFFPQTDEKMMPFVSDISNSETVNGELATTDVEDLYTEGDVSTPKLIPPKNVEEDGPTDEEDVVASGDEFIDDQLDISHPEVDLDLLVATNLQEVVNLTEGYAKEEDEIQGRHQKNLKKAEVLAKSFDLHQDDVPDEGLTGSEDMEDSAVEEDIQRDDEGVEMPEHFMQGESSFASHNVVNSVEPPTLSGCKKKNRSKARGVLEVLHPEGTEGITDTEELPVDNKRPRRRRKKKPRKEAPIKSSINVVSGVTEEEGITDTELLLPVGSSDSASSDDEIEHDLEDHNDKGFCRTDDENFSASDGNEDYVIHSVNKEYPSVVPDYFDEQIKVSEKNEEEIPEEGTDEEGFQIDEREDDDPLVRPLPQAVPGTVKILDLEVDDDESHGLTDIEDVDIEESEDREIIDDILDKIPTDETNILIDMECVSNEAVGLKSEASTDNIGFQTLPEDNEGTLIDMEEWERGGDAATVPKNNSYYEVSRRTDDTDTESVEGSDEERSKYSPKKKSSRKLPLVPQLSEVRFVETEDGNPLSIIITPAEGHRIEDNVRGVVFLEHDDPLTDIEELVEEGSEERFGHESSHEFSDEGPLTDYEDFVTELPTRPETPTPPDEIVLSSPSRQNIKITEDKFGVCKVSIEKMKPDDALLSPLRIRENVLTDIEDLSDEDANWLSDEMDDKCSVLLDATSATEVVSKSKNKKQRCLKTVDHTTDEEDVGETLPVPLIHIQNELSLTDVEDVETSSESGDDESSHAATPLPTPEVIRKSFIKKTVVVKEGPNGDSQIEIENDTGPTPYLAIVGSSEPSGTTDVEDIEISGDEGDVGKPLNPYHQACLPNQEGSRVTMSETSLKPFASDVEESEIKDFLLHQECRQTPPQTEVESLDDEGEETGDAFGSEDATTIEAKNYLKEVDLAILESIVAAQEAEVEEMSSAADDGAELPLKQISVEEGYPSSDEGGEGRESLTLMRGSPPTWEEEEIKSEDPLDEGRPIKAEIKLLVKTTETGKESIEIRSIREFVNEENNMPKCQPPPPSLSSKSDKAPSFSEYEAPLGHRTPGPRFVRPPEETSMTSYDDDVFGMMAQVRDNVGDPLSERVFLLPPQLSDITSSSKIDDRDVLLVTALANELVNDAIRRAISRVILTNDDVITSHSSAIDVKTSQFSGESRLGEGSN